MKSNRGDRVCAYWDGADITNPRHGHLTGAEVLEIADGEYGGHAVTYCHGYGRWIQGYCGEDYGISTIYRDSGPGRGAFPVTHLVRVPA